MARRKVAAKNKATKDSRKTTTTNADHSNAQSNAKVKIKSKGDAIRDSLEPSAAMATTATTLTHHLIPHHLHTTHPSLAADSPVTNVPTDHHPPPPAKPVTEALPPPSPASTTMVSSPSAMSGSTSSSAPKPPAAVVSVDHNKYLHKKFKRIASATLDESTPKRSSPPPNDSAFNQSTHSAAAGAPTTQTQSSSVKNGLYFGDASPLCQSFADGVNGHDLLMHRTATEPNSRQPPSERELEQRIPYSEAVYENAIKPQPLHQLDRGHQVPISHSPTQKKHNNNNNNYSSNNHNTTNPVQQQQLSMFQSNSGGVVPTSIAYMPSMISHNTSNTSFTANHRPPAFHAASSSSASPGQLDVQMLASSRVTPDQVLLADALAHHTQQHHQQQLLFKQHMLQQQHHQFALSEETVTSSHPTPLPTSTAPPPPHPASVSPTPGRYVCSYCSLNCAKPSVLQKHIRAHTNERPYPCSPCGFAFKTRSNLYKHCRSRAHLMRLQGGEPQPEDEASLGSDPDQDLSSSASSDVISRTASPLDDRVSSPSAASASYAQAQNQSTVLEKPYKPKFHNASLYTKDEQQQHHLSNNQREQPSTQPTTTLHQYRTQPSIIVPPAAAAQFSPMPSCSTPSTSNISHPLSTQNVEYLKEHISKIISQNEAIMEVVEPALQKKYHKITGISRGHMVNETTNSKLSNALQKQRDESANNVIQANPTSIAATPAAPLSNKHSQPSTSGVFVSASASAAVPGPSGHQRRSLPTLKQHAQQAIQSQVAAVAQQQPHHHHSTTSSTSSPLNLSRLSIDVLTNTHPQNPERSIIKDLLLNSRGLAVPSGGEGEDAVYTCPLCKINFRSADNLQYHTQNYCQGQPQSHNGSPQSAPISPVGSPSHKYFRSNSFHANLPEKYNPNTLAKLASSTLKHPNKTPPSLAKLASTLVRPGRSKPDNIVINTDTCPAPTPLDTKPGCSSTPSASAQCVQITRLIEVDTPLPSPGPLLGKTRLVDTFHQTVDRKITEEAIISHFADSDVVYHQSHRVDQIDETKSAFGHSSKRSSLRNPDTYAQCIPMYTEPPAQHRMSGGELKLMDRRNVDVQRHNHDQETIFNPMMSPNTVRNNQRMCGGDFKIVDRREEMRNQPNFGSSGGSIVSIVSISPSASPHLQSYADQNGIAMQMGLHSGGSMMDTQSPKENHVQTPKIQMTPSGQSMPYFQYPINTITAYNPLTLPPVHINPGQSYQIMHAGKLIPFVPGIPGPNSFMIPKPDSKALNRGLSPNRRMIPSPLSLPPTPTPPTMSPHPKQTPLTPRNIPTIRVADVDNLKQQPRKSIKNGYHHHAAIPTAPVSAFPSPQPTTQWSPAKKKFNFTRMADNLSPRKPPQTEPSTEPEYRYFDFEKPGHSLRPHDIKPQHIAPLHIDITSVDDPTTTTTTAEPSQPQTPLLTTPKHTKFLRPSSLPLKPGTFTPKHHHGITPTANTLPLISPETPRPSKNCVQLYLNGHAYTYLGLKCSTKTFYCTVNRPQPVHFTNQHKLSIYSNWQICAESNPHPLGLTPKVAMALYDSRQLPTNVSTAKMGPTCIMLHSQSLLVVATADADGADGAPSSKDHDEDYRNQSQQLYATNSRLAADARSHLSSIGGVEPPVQGGYESTEDYTYVRGRGRGKYVCFECGIRCKKPSMLKKHIRTHTDVRPYTCSHCSFSFKTKGNLTKHMKSKAHYKKCKELGLSPLPIDDDECPDDDMDCDSTSGDHTSTMPGDDSDSDDMSDGDDGCNDSSDTDNSRFRMPEHEAAKSLLFLSQTPRSHNASPNHLIPGRPMTYPYGGVKFDLAQGASIVGAGAAIPFPVTALSVNTEPNAEHLVARRSISFTSPVNDYVPLKQDQYYSNPKVPMMSPKENGVIHKMDEYSMPMDLTKPRATPKTSCTAPKQRLPMRQPTPKSSVSEVLSLAQPGPAGLLTSLVSITDNLPQYQIPNADQDKTVLLQSYLTERAMQERKMKQNSHMFRTQLPTSSFVNTLTSSKGCYTSSCVTTMSSVQTCPNNGMLLATIPSSNANNQTKLSEMDGPNRSAYILKEPNRKVVVPRPNPTHDHLVVNTAVSELPFNVNPFDALKNSPNPSKVTYSKAPLSDGVPWSMRDEMSLLPLPTTLAAEQPTVVYSITDVPTKVTIIAQNSPEAIPANEPSSTIGMDTLAEIAASSVKLDTTKPSPPPSMSEEQPTAALYVTPLPQPSAVMGQPTTVQPQSGNSAKSVATEYLKRTSAEYLRAHFNKSDREDTDDSDSEGEPNTMVGASSSSDPAASTARTVVVGEDGFRTAPPTTTADVATVHRGFIQEDGRSVCKICSKTFPKKHQMILHMNIHYMERKFRCEPCGVGFRTHSTLQKHERGEAHKNKVLMTSTFGVPSTTNPRPFECSDCKIAFRIHGHLAKHLRSKTHVQKLECLQKLPFGTYAEIERASVSLTDIDTTDCENSLASLRVLAQRLLEKDPSKWPDVTGNAAAGKEDDVGEAGGGGEAGVVCSGSGGLRGDSSNSDGDGDGEPIGSSADDGEGDQMSEHGSGGVEGTSSSAGDKRKAVVTEDNSGTDDGMDAKRPKHNTEEDV